MSDKKPELYTIEGPLIDKYPESTVKQFVLDIQSGLKPSKALNNFITENKCNELHYTVIFDMLNKAYENIETGMISGFIIDAGYPYCDSGEMSDEDFDSHIERALY